MIPFLFICNLEEFCDGSIIRSEVKIQLQSNHVKKMVCVYHVCRVYELAFHLRNADRRV